MTEEIWKDIKNYEGIYRVSNSGQIKSLSRIIKAKNRTWLQKERILKPGINECGYAFVGLSGNGRIWPHKISRLVAIAFKPNPLGLPEVNHIDGNKLNNNDWNLEWSSVSHNRKHAYASGLNKGRKGTGKVPDSIVKQIFHSNLSTLELSRMLGLNASTIYDIKARKTYKHVCV
jgi:hypothetical protein